jgi:hypothetical protein
MLIRGPAPIASTSFTMPSDVPDISADDVAAVVARSKSAADLDARFRGYLGDGGCCSDRDLEHICKRAHGRDGRVNADHAVVMAYWAQHHGEVFAPECHARLARFLREPDWVEIRTALDALRDKLEQQRIEDEKKRELEKERLLDDVIKPMERHRELIKENGTLAERADERLKLEVKKADEKAKLREASELDVDEELTDRGRLSLSDVEMATLGLLKKGFANRG